MLKSPHTRALGLGALISFRSHSLPRLGAIVATAIAVMFLAFACVLPQAITQRTDHANARIPHQQYVNDMLQEPWILSTMDLKLIGDKKLTVFYTADGQISTEDVAPPPGIPSLPPNNSYYASPKLQALIDAGSVTIPGSSLGTIHDSGLQYPDELVAWVGSTREALERENIAYSGSFGGPLRKVQSFGVPDAEKHESIGMNSFALSPPVQILLFVCAIVSAIPCILAAQTACTLIARQRVEMLSKFTLIGLSQKTIRLLSTGETLYIQVLGWVLGLTAAWGLEPLARTLTPSEAQWFTSETHILNPLIMVCALVIISAGCLAALKPPRKARRRGRFLPVLCFATGIVTMLLCVHFKVEMINAVEGSLLFIGLAGLTLVALSLRGCIMWVTGAVASAIKSFSPSILLGTARLRKEPTAASRGPAAIGLAVLAVSLSTMITGQLFSYIIAPVNQADNDLTVVESTHAEDVARNVPGGVLVSHREDGIQINCEQVRSLLHRDCANGARGISRHIAYNNAGHPLNLADTPEPIQHPNVVAYRNTDLASLDPIYRADPFAVVTNRDVSIAAYLYAKGSIFTLYRTAGWWTVATCTLFAIVAAGASASGRKRLTAALGVVGVNARTQRLAWLIYAAVPLLVAVALGAGTAFIADWCFVTLVEIPGALGWASVIEPLIVGAIVALVAGGAYAAISMTAAREKVTVSDLRRV